MGTRKARRELKFAVSTALLAGAAGCTGTQDVAVNPGPTEAVPVRADPVEPADKIEDEVPPPVSVNPGPEDEVPAVATPVVEEPSPKPKPEVRVNTRREPDPKPDPKPVIANPGPEPAPKPEPEPKPKTRPKPKVMVNPARPLPPNKN